MANGEEKRHTRHVWGAQLGSLLTLALVLLGGYQWMIHQIETMHAHIDQVDKNNSVMFERLDKRITATLNEIDTKNIAAFGEVQSALIEIVLDDGQVTRENIVGWQDGINRELGEIKGFLDGFAEGIEHKHRTDPD